MTDSRLAKSAAVVGLLLVIAAAVATVSAQNGPVPNPYREDANWAKLPPGRNGEA